LVHVIARFVNHQFRLTGDAERQALLDRLPTSLARVDWVLHAYALMSSHIHLALIAGEEPAWRWLKPLHVGVAGQLNRMHSSFGPVFAERPTMVLMPPARLGVLAAYLHNNPVRAGVATVATESNWTSHRAWVGLEPAPSWLAVDAGLQLAGFERTDAGRAAFGLFVRATASGGKDADLSGLGVARLRTAARTRTRLPAEVSSTVLEGDAEVSSLIVIRGAPGLARWDGDMDLILRCVGARLCVSVEDMRSRRRAQRIVHARRLVALAAVVMLRREVGEVAAAFGLSGPAIGYLLRTSERLLPLARGIAAEVVAGDIGR
jgi:hypothetical protein